MGGSGYAEPEVKTDKQKIEEAEKKREEEQAAREAHKTDEPKADDTKQEG